MAKALSKKAETTKNGQTSRIGSFEVTRIQHKSTFCHFRIKITKTNYWANGGPDIKIKIMNEGSSSLEIISHFIKVLIISRRQKILNRLQRGIIFETILRVVQMFWNFAYLYFKTYFRNNLKITCKEFWRHIHAKLAIVSK